MSPLICLLLLLTGNYNFEIVVHSKKSATMKHSAFAFISLFFLLACADDAPKEKNYIQNGVAIKGYDPVAYFESEEAQIGDPQWTATHDGVTYHFSSAENQALFLSTPQNYLPAYGGWCAYAIAANNNKMEPDPTMWKIQDGKLLLFYDDWMSSVTGTLLEEWNTEPENYQQKADHNWKEMHP